MKTAAPLLLALALAVTSPAWTAEAPPQFNGVLTVGGESYFVLVDAAGQLSPLLRRGALFQGYTVMAYDPVSHLLELQREGRALRLPLAGPAQIQAGSSTFAGVSAKQSAAEVFRTDRKKFLSELHARVPGRREYFEEMRDAPRPGIVDGLKTPAFAMIEGRPHVVFGEMKFAVGDSIRIPGSTAVPEIKILRADATSFMVEHEGVVYTRPVAPAF